MTAKARRLSDPRIAKMKEDPGALDRRIADQEARRKADRKAAEAKEAERIEKRRVAAARQLGGALLAGIREGDDSIIAMAPSLLGRTNVAARKIAEAPIAGELGGVELTFEQEWGTPPSAQFTDRLEVKKPGAKFNREDKMWYAPPGANLPEFA